MAHDGSSGVNLQDDLFLHAKRDGKIITIYLLGGVKLSGRVKGYDKFTLLLESKDHEQLIYKHAISTVTFVRGEARRPPMAPEGRSPATRHEAPQGERRPDPSAPPSEGHGSDDRDQRAR